MANSQNAASYAIVMFAYNEEKNIKSSVSSAMSRANDSLVALHVVANGCSDQTVPILRNLQRDYDKLNVVDLALGDKCNAWNHYVNVVAPELAADVHFFIDADVSFSENCFSTMANHLSQSGHSTVAIAGMPLSGRNRAFYESLVIERSCFFGNLYGLKASFLKKIRTKKFRLPMGLNWIDSFLTKMVNTDFTFGAENLSDRVTYIKGCGYQFESLSPFSMDAIKLYINRIARYELGKIQEKYLDALPVEQWPESTRPINETIKSNLEADLQHLSFIKRYLVRKRLNKLLKK